MRNKIYDLLQNKLEMGIENVVIELSRQTVKKNKNRLRPIVTQLLFYKGKMNILTVKNLNTKVFIFEDFSSETAAIHKENDKKFFLTEKKV